MGALKLQQLANRFTHGRWRRVQFCCNNTSSKFVPQKKRSKLPGNGLQPHAQTSEAAEDFALFEPLCERRACCTVSGRELATIRDNARALTRLQQRRFLKAEAGPTIEELLVWPSFSVRYASLPRLRAQSTGH